MAEQATQVASAKAVLKAAKKVATEIAAAKAVLHSANRRARIAAEKKKAATKQAAKPSSGCEAQLAAAAGFKITKKAAKAKKAVKGRIGTEGQRSKKALGCGGDHNKGRLLALTL
jgi:hypothetical protein